MNIFFIYLLIDFFVKQFHKNNKKEAFLRKKTLTAVQILKDWLQTTDIIGQKVNGFYVWVSVK